MPLILPRPRIIVPRRRIILPAGRRPVVRPSIPLRRRRRVPGPHHHPGCPMHRPAVVMVDGDAALDADGDELLDANGDTLLECCCGPCLGGACGPAGGSTMTATISGASIPACVVVAALSSYSYGGDPNGTYSIPVPTPGPSTPGLVCENSMAPAPGATVQHFNSGSCGGFPTSGNDILGYNYNVVSGSLVVIYQLAAAVVTDILRYTFTPALCTGSATVTGTSAVAGVTPGTCTVSF